MKNLCHAFWSFWESGDAILFKAWSPGHINPKEGSDSANLLCLVFCVGTESETAGPQTGKRYPHRGFYTASDRIFQRNLHILQYISSLFPKTGFVRTYLRGAHPWDSGNIRGGLSHSVYLHESNTRIVPRFICAFKWISLVLKRGWLIEYVGGITGSKAHMNLWYCKVSQ